jgi:FMN-dependent oxidoreductase (nitrilotriacetate monooxygenase family)
MPGKRKLSLNLFVYPGGHHEAAWRHKNADISRLRDIRFYQELAQEAEKAKFDALFFADGPVLEDNIRYAARFRTEPITWLSAIAVATSRIGLIATASTTYFEPYNLARLFASLDLLSGGRAGWNIVTTSAGAASRNFGLVEHPEHSVRYERGREFVDVVTKLWDSWEDDAIIADKESGLFADDTRIHAIEHIGAHFKVKGPLNTPRSPQGRPVYVQAGSSEDGRGFAAQYAEAIFTAHQSIESAQDFYKDIKKRVALLGRNPDHVRVLPGISPFIGGTEEEALKLEREFNDLIQPEFSLYQLKHMLGVDLSGYDLDGPFPRDILETNGKIGEASRFKLVVDVIDREKPTIRQLIERLAGARGHFVKTGTPEQIAGEIASWFENGAADGFNVMPPWLPGGFTAFAEEVVPLLRKRGIFREEYEGETLRDHYGLPRPPSLYSEPARASA